MAIQDRGFELALNGIKTGATHVILYGFYQDAVNNFISSDFEDDNNTLVKKSITWSNPVNSSGWQLVTDPSGTILFEFTQDIIDSYFGYFEVEGIKVLDASENVILQRALVSNAKFDVPGELTIDEIKITASN